MLYAYTEAVDRTPARRSYGKTLARRPRNALTAVLDWTTPWAGLALGPTSASSRKPMTMQPIPPAQGR
jgi:hypothetical protein